MQEIVKHYQLKLHELGRKLERERLDEVERRKRRATREHGS